MQGTAFHENQTQVLRFALEQRFKELQTMMPGIVEKYDAEKRTVKVKPALNIVYTNQPPQERQPLENVPVVFPGGKDFSITWELEEGDPVIIIYSHRGLGNFTKKLENYSDGNDLTANPETNTRKYHDPVVLPLRFYKKGDDNEIGITGNEIGITGNEISITGKSTKDEDDADVPAEIKVSTDDGMNIYIRNPYTIGEGSDAKSIPRGILLYAGEIDETTGYSNSYIEITEDRIWMKSPVVISDPVPKDSSSL